MIPEVTEVLINRVEWCEILQSECTHVTFYCTLLTTKKNIGLYVVVFFAGAYCVCVVVVFFWGGEEVTLIITVKVDWA